MATGTQEERDLEKLGEIERKLHKASPEHDHGRGGEWMEEGEG